MTETARATEGETEREITEQLVLHLSPLIIGTYLRVYLLTIIMFCESRYLTNDLIFKSILHVVNASGIKGLSLTF